jgi:hypothetical protein
VGWLVARIGSDNPIASAADSIGTASPYLVALLWAMAALSLYRTRLAQPSLARDSGIPNSHLRWSLVQYKK